MTTLSSLLRTPLLIGLGLLFVTCNGSSSSNSTKSIKGQLSSTLRSNSSALGISAEPVFNVNRVCGHPVQKQGGISGGSMLSNIYCVDVSADGTFQIPVGNTEFDWVYLLIDTSLPKKDQVAGFVGLSDLKSYMVVIPTSNVTGDLDVGTIDQQAGGENSSSQTLTQTSASFNLSMEQLQVLAKNSTLFKGFKNNYVNYDQISNKYYWIYPRYHWQPSLAASVGKFADPPTADQFYGYFFQFMTNDADFSPANLCQGGSINMKFASPSEVTAYGPESSTYIVDATHPINSAALGPIDGTNGGCSNSAPPPLWVGPGDGATSTAMMTILSGMYLKDAPAGLWTLSKNDVPVGWFDLAMTMPFVDGDMSKKILGPIPLLKITKDASDVITQLDVTWRYYDPASGDYVAASTDADMEMVTRLIGGGFGIGLIGNGYVTQEFIYPKANAGEKLASSFSNFSHTWKMTAERNSGTEEVFKISLEYGVGAVNLGFWYSY